MSQKNQKQKIKNQAGPQTPTDQEIEYCTKLIDNAVVPKIEDIINAFNTYIQLKININVGVELTWIFEKIEGDNKDDSGN